MEKKEGGGGGGGGGQPGSAPVNCKYHGSKVNSHFAGPAWWLGCMQGTKSNPSSAAGIGLCFNPTISNESCLCELATHKLVDCMSLLPND